jgi:hypothetical protein
VEILLIERDSSRRVAIAKHMCRSGHRVTLTSSLIEAQELSSFIDSETKCPSAVLIAEELLGRPTAAFRAELAARFPDLAWVPVRPDVDLDWLRTWLERTTAHQTRARRRSLRILLVEPDALVRREVNRRLSALGDRVLARSSLAAAAADIARCVDRPESLDVLIAPVSDGAQETISLFLAAKKRLPLMRWIVPAQQPANRPSRADASRPIDSTFAEIDRLRRSAIRNGRTPA